MSKVSIRFFNDREVRAIWDDENSKWWFSATDNIQVVSLTHDFKFQVPDGKKRAADALDYDGVQILAKNFTNNSRYTPIFLTDCMILPAKSAQNQRPRNVHERNRLFILLRGSGMRQL